MAKSKPKFWVDQIVMARGKLTNSSGSIVRATMKEPLTIKQVFPITNMALVARGCDEFAVLLSDIRPLTAREIGPARPARRRSGKT